MLIFKKTVTVSAYFIVSLTRKLWKCIQIVCIYSTVEFLSSWRREFILEVISVVLLTSSHLKAEIFQGMFHTDHQLYMK